MGGVVIAGPAAGAVAAGTTEDDGEGAIGGVRVVGVAAGTAGEGEPFVVAGGAGDASVFGERGSKRVREGSELELGRGGGGGGGNRVFLCFCGCERGEG